MSKEIVYALESISDEEIMKSFIKLQDINGCTMLINALRYTKSETESRWLDVYSRVFKY